jgi:hypothetical protein
LPILGGNPFLEEAVVRNYSGGSSFTTLLTSSRCLTNGSRRNVHFHGRPGYIEWRSAFGYVIAFRRKCRAAKWANLMPRARANRSVPQEHRVRPFFQYNPRGAFRASAAKIRVHRRPPAASGNNRIVRHALIATNEVRRITASQKAYPGRSHFTFSQILFNTVEPLGLAEGLRIG